MNSNFYSIYKIRDSIDVYLYSDNILIFYFSNTRKYIEFKTSLNSIYLISLIDGNRTIENIYELYSKKNIYNKIKKNTILEVFDFLLYKNIIYCIDNVIFNEYYHRYDRQISYLSEFLPVNNSINSIQDKISKSSILIFGVGAVGGSIAILLAMSGVQQFTLIDYKNISTSSSTRHTFYRNSYIGKSKVECLKKEILKINKSAKINAIPMYLNYDTDISNYIKETDFVVNAADYPYIGYTSMKISRESIKNGKLHYIAGGFDSHLASTGELIIPGITPCADCYKSYFDVALKNWNPEKKNIEYSCNEMGGFSSQSLFSASFACIQIIKSLCFIKDGILISRGELDFETYSINYLNIERDKNCKVCGDIK